MFIRNATRNLALYTRISKKNLGVGIRRRYKFFLEVVDTKIYYKFWMRPYNLLEKMKKKYLYALLFIKLIKIIIIPRLIFSFKFLVFLSNLGITLIYLYFWTFSIYKNFIKTQRFFLIFSSCLYNILGINCLTFWLSFWYYFHLFYMPALFRAFINRKKVLPKSGFTRIHTIYWYNNL